jgi:mannitol-1-phosphate/altronate dehydrogenase
MVAFHTGEGMGTRTMAFVAQLGRFGEGGFGRGFVAEFVGWLQHNPRSPAVVR